MARAYVDGDAELSLVNALLEAKHYLGPVKKGIAYADEHGAMVFAGPRSRRLPPRSWLELVRWCLFGNYNGGSKQWHAAVEWLRVRFPDVTTVISYSDPSAGHTGALYRACNWLWAPTWHRLRPPPSGNGDWGTGKQAVKDRWVFVLAPDAEREKLLALQDDALMRKMPWAQYREPKFRRGVPVGGTGGGNFKRWRGQ